MTREKKPPKPPLQTGNFAPVHHQYSLTPCKYHGTIPPELIGGQYVRNGANAFIAQQPGRAEHWFDGDGMLSGVFFRRTSTTTEDEDGVTVEYVNRFVVTDVLRTAGDNPMLDSPILPSIAAMIDPVFSLLGIVYSILRTMAIVLWSWFSRPIKRIGVANTSIIHHDGRVLATCESGPPMRVFLPNLRTVGWFDGWRAEGESVHQMKQAGFGGKGLLGFLREWTTGHPHVDPQTGEMILFHSTFIKPYVRYSVIPSQKKHQRADIKPIYNTPIPGIPSPKMMHDFGVSHNHTVIIDMPLSLDPFNLTRNKPVVIYDPDGKTRFGVFPRYEPDQVAWFETDACTVFHTVNTWDEPSSSINKEENENKENKVNMLCSRMKTASVLFAAGNIQPPSTNPRLAEECRLYYYQFDLSANLISHQWALSAIELEFVHVPPQLEMSDARFVYGCSTTHGSFDEALGAGVKIDCLVKVDVAELLARGRRNPPTQITGCVDGRSIRDVIEADDPDDPVKVLMMPDGWYAQECSFIPRRDAVEEDDGWLVTFVFDESQLDQYGDAPEDAKSEFWVIDARNMRDVVARVVLPQRVPYGLHGNWFCEDEILNQRPVERFRDIK